MGVRDWWRQHRERADRLEREQALWGRANTLADLGELTAQWLEGAISWQPGYYGSVDVDEDDAPGLAATLAALNRAGLVTNSSQAGDDGEGYDGARWRQHAAVTGYADGQTRAWIEQALAGSGYEVDVWPRKRGLRSGATRYVTFREDMPVTNFGQLGRLAIRDSYDGCSGRALRQLRDAWQITIYDPRPGRNDMWPLLRAVADQQLQTDQADAATGEDRTDMDNNTDHGYRNARHLQHLAQRCEAGAAVLLAEADNAKQELAERAGGERVDPAEWAAQKRSAAQAAQAYAQQLRDEAGTLGPVGRVSRERIGQAEKVATAAELGGILVDSSRLDDAAAADPWKSAAEVKVIQDYKEAKRAEIEATGAFEHVTEPGQVPLWRLRSPDDHDADGS